MCELKLIKLNSALSYWCRWLIPALSSHWSKNQCSTVSLLFKWLLSPPHLTPLLSLFQAYNYLYQLTRLIYFVMPQWILNPNNNIQTLRVGWTATLPCLDASLSACAAPGEMLQCIVGVGRQSYWREKALASLVWINHLIPSPQGQQSIGYCRSLHKNSPLSPTAAG